MQKILEVCGVKIEKKMKKEYFEFLKAKGTNLNKHFKEIIFRELAQKKLIELPQVLEEKEK